MDLCGPEPRPAFNPNAVQPDPAALVPAQRETPPTELKAHWLASAAPAAAAGAGLDLFDVVEQANGTHWIRRGPGWVDSPRNVTWHADLSSYRRPDVIPSHPLVILSP